MGDITTTWPSWTADYDDWPEMGVITTTWTAEDLKALERMLREPWPEWCS